MIIYENNPIIYILNNNKNIYFKKNKINKFIFVLLNNLNLNYY